MMSCTSPPSNGKHARDLLDWDARQLTVTAIATPELLAGHDVTPDVLPPGPLRTVLTAALDLVGRGQTPDVVSLAHELDAAGRLDDLHLDGLTGRQAIDGLVRAVAGEAVYLPLPGPALGRLREHRRRERIKSRALDVARMADDPATSTDDLVDFADGLTAHEGRRGCVPTSLSTLIRTYPVERPEVIDHIVRRSEVLNVIASPKIGKSWLVVGMLYAVATGQPWLGHATRRGRVLLLDYELHPETLACRLRAVAAAMSIDPADLEGWLDVVAMRETSPVLLPDLSQYLRAVQPGQYALIVVDALYRLLPPDADENSNSSMTRCWNILDQIARATDAAVCIVHHASKGNQSAKSVTDVGAGAGAQSRAADSHLVLRPHEEAGLVVLESVVRSFPPTSPTCIEFTFPVWQTRDDADPTLLAGRLPPATERRSKADREGMAKILECLKAKPMTVSELRRQTGISRERCDRLLNILTAAKRIDFTATKKRGNDCLTYHIADVGDVGDVDRPRPAHVA